MSDVDPLEAALARARSPSTFVESRPFTLAREKAIEKQREFALRTPAQVVLELVQGAVFAGATAIAIETDPDRLMVAWVGGRPISEEELEGWVDHLFADRRDPEMRAMLQLATGINALLQRGPKHVWVETGMGEHALRLELDRHGDGRIGDVPDRLDATFVIAAFRRSLWNRLTASAVTEELRLVEERCLYTPVPIYLNGQAPFGYRPTRHIEIFGADQQAHFDDGHRRGVVATHRHPAATPGFRAVVGGVWITTLPLPELQSQELLGVLCDDGLRKTADHADIVQDQGYVELLHAVQPHATQVLRARDPDYSPPALPPLDGQSQAEAAPPIALPDRIPSLPGRRAIPLDRLDGHPGPLFVVEPPDRERLATGSMRVDRFPWTVLVLTSEQTDALAQKLPGVTLHRLMSPSDAEFVRRALERGEPRLATGAVAEATVELERRPTSTPDGGTGLSGWPYEVHGPEGLLDAGVLANDQAISSLAAGPDPRPLRPPIPLDGMILRVRGASRLEVEHLLAAADIAWQLAVEPADEGWSVVDPSLLAALLGQVVVTVPTEDGPCPTLPGGWPAALLDLPLVADLTANHLVADAAAGTVRPIDDDDWRAVSEVAARIGAGHLAAPCLDRPVLGVGKVGDHWMWLEDATMWALPAITVICGVYGHRGEREAPAGWELLATSEPLVALQRAGRRTPPAELEPGWALLRERLTRKLVDGEDWQIHTRPGIGSEHLRGMARAALHRLAPAEPSPSPPPTARSYVVQIAVERGGLRGTVGLVHPFDRHSHVELRTLRTHHLLDLDPHAPPVQGRLWAHAAPDREALDALHLATLQLDRALLEQLSRPMPPDERATASAYAIDRVLRAPRTDRGVAAALARRVELAGEDGLPWGSLAQWLDTDEARRPSLPVPTPQTPPPTVEPELSERLQLALDGRSPPIRLVADDHAHSGRSWVDAGRSHSGQLVLRYRDADPLVAEALAAPGRSRELLLMHLARLACAWTNQRGGPDALAEVFARLIAQRTRRY